MSEVPRRSRRHGAELEDALLRAAWDELSEVGYTHLTMEGVAARAHTGKQVLYRRWPRRVDLVVAAVRKHTGSIADRVPDTGSLRGDVLALLAWGSARWHDIGSDIVHGLLAELPHIDPGAFAAMEQAMTTIHERAAARGEIATADINPRVATLPATLLRHESLLTPTPVTEQTRIDIVDQVYLPLLNAVTGTAPPRHERTDHRTRGQAVRASGASTASPAVLPT